MVLEVEVLIMVPRTIDSNEAPMDSQNSRVKHVWMTPFNNVLGKATRLCQGLLTMKS